MAVKNLRHNRVSGEVPEKQNIQYLRKNFYRNNGKVRAAPLEQINYQPNFALHRPMLENMDQRGMTGIFL